MITYNRMMSSSSLLHQHIKGLLRRTGADHIALVPDDARCKHTGYYAPEFESGYRSARPLTKFEKSEIRFQAVPSPPLVNFGLVRKDGCPRSPKRERAALCSIVPERAAFRRNEALSVFWRPDKPLKCPQRSDIVSDKQKSSNWGCWSPKLTIVDILAGIGLDKIGSLNETEIARNSPASFAA